MSRPKNRELTYSVRLDWTQLTAQTNQIKAEEFADAFYDLKRKLNEDGFEQKKVVFPRYEGFEVGPVKFMTGTANGHRMMIASGNDAPMLAEYAKRGGFPANPSRLDGRIEIEYKETQRDLGQWAWDRIRANDLAKGRTTRTKLKLYDDKHSDTGIKSGADEADIKWKFYDSGFHHQKRTDSRCWAMEVTLHKNPAKAFWTDYLASSDAAKLTAEMVATRFKKLGVIEPGLRGLEPRAYSGTRKIASNEGKLLYIDKTMCSMLKKLALDGFGGDLTAIFRAHGLIDENGVFLPLLRNDE